ncbi:hypothetical protein C8Q74DRAFT_1371410 [Fomes fomentarius]|nr:hypothetical protein C8Q74DRAFT_1371410 [Fomes fomentarius]
MSHPVREPEDTQVDHISEHPRCASGWNALAKEWWKKGAEALKPTNIMELPFWRSTWAELLESTNGKFYVREEYPALYKRLEEASTLQSGRMVEFGVVFTGQPGNGKSILIFGVYTLLRRLAAGQPVIYYYWHPNVIYFSSGSAVKLVLSDLENYPTPDTAWPLIEPRSDQNLIDTSLVDSLLFTVAFISPHEPRLKPLVTKSQLTRWIMPLWTND